VAQRQRDAVSSVFYTKPIYPLPNLLPEEIRTASWMERVFTCNSINLVRGRSMIMTGINDEVDYVCVDWIRDSVDHAYIWLVKIIDNVWIGLVEVS
jgi:hypothetical protein